MWEQLVKHPEFDRLKVMYNENFPLEVRHVCAQWIEDRMKIEQSIDANDPQYDQRAVNFVSNFITQLELEKNKLQGKDEFSIRYRLDESIKRFTQRMCNPVQLYKHIRDTILYEQHFLESYSSNPQQMNFMDGEQMEITEKIKELRKMVLINSENQNRYKHDLEQYMLRYSEGSRQIQELNSVQMTPEIEERRNRFLLEFKNQIELMTETINKNRSELYSNICAVIEALNETQKIVIHKRLGKWQREQALSGNGFHLMHSGLDEIQSWLEGLADSIVNTRSTIDAMRKMPSIPIQTPNGGNDYFDAAYRDIVLLLQNLIVSSFIVEKQPPQVMKTNTR